MGYLIYLIPNTLHKAAKTNIELCFPELAAQQRARLYKQSFIELGRAAAETGALLVWNKQRTLKLVKKVTGEELVQQAFSKGEGVIIAAPHLGAWEMIGLYCSSRNPMTSLYRPLRMAQLNPFVKAARERMGAVLVPTNASGVRALYKALEQNQMIGILPDQDPGDEGGVFAPFFGIPASTMTLLPRLSQKTGASVIFSYAERLPRGRGFHVHFQSMPATSPARGLEEAAAQLNKGVENCVRQSPEQYQWSYKRFKTRPQDEAAFY
ncbi:MAG: lysophospholipid acyltransferase family protein [Gammaproteobacteria bacterium]|nr:lysophospholipid acyltransferase family protein [Gammaproteobacteria bacterium]